MIALWIQRKKHYANIIN